ncbi:MAG: hypothetical protein AAGI36_01095 [Pseudomonadota bacterium]
MARRVASPMMALTGAIFFFAFVFQDIRIHPEIPAGELPWGLIIRYGVAMTLGGAVAGYLMAGLFGRSGIGGWILSFLAGTLATLLLGLVGSAFGLIPDLADQGLTSGELVQITLGALVVPLSLIEQPYLILVLLVLFGATHELCVISKRNS